MKRSTRQTRAGYTIVELLMAITVFAIGVTGIAAMQKVTLASNLHAKRLALATHIAQSWQERLVADGSLWLATASDRTNTQLLTAGNTWARAPEIDGFGPTFGPLGEYTSDSSKAFFCVYVRLTDMLSNGTPIDGNGLLRTEVLVFWPREGRDPSSDAPFCDSDAGLTLDQNSDDNFHFVHKVSAVRQST